MNINIPVKKIAPLIILALITVFLVIKGDESRLPIFTYADHMKVLAGNTNDGSVMISGDDNLPGIFLEGPSYLLDPGVYHIKLNYEASDKGSSIVIIDNGRPVSAYDLVPGETEGDYPFTLTSSSQKLSYAISFGGAGSLRIDSARLFPEGKFYNDSYYIAAVIILLIIVSCLALLRFKPSASVIIILFTGLAASLPYLDKGLGWAIDLCYHLVRIEGIKDGLISGAFPVLIYPEGLSGNGYLGAMYPALFLYPAAFLRLLGVSMADSFKSLIILINIAAAGITYKSAKELGCSPAGALMAAVVYTLSPYRLTNIYARGAVGEFLAMTFFPPVIAGLYQIIKGKREKWPLLTLGMCGLLYSHLLSVAIAGVICFVLCLVFIKDLARENRMLSLIKAAVLSALLCLGFLIPFIIYQSRGNLWMSALDSGGDFINTQLNPSGIFALSLSGDYHVLSLGLPIGICAALGALYAFETFFFGDDERYDQPKSYASYLIALFTVGIIFLYMTSAFFPARELTANYPLIEQFLSKLQFAWRLLGPSSVLLVLCGAMALSNSKRLIPYEKALVIFLCITCVFSILRFSDEDFSNRPDRDYSPGHESKITGIPRGDNTIVYPFEWRPEGTSDDSITTNVIRSDETVELLLYYRSGTTSTLIYSDIEEGSFIEIPVIYYPGYSAVDESGTPIDITPGTGSRIRIPLNSDGYEHTVTISFTPPSPIYLGWIISFAAAIIFAAVYILYKSGKLETTKLKGLLIWIR